MGNKITIKHIKTSEQFFLTGHKNFVSALCISPSGELIASGQINHHGFKVMNTYDKLNITDISANYFYEYNKKKNIKI